MSDFNISGLKKIHFLIYTTPLIWVESKAIPATGHGGQ
jgi:hypothetical protein